MNDTGSGFLDAASKEIERLTAAVDMECAAKEAMVLEIEWLRARNAELVATLQIVGGQIERAEWQTAEEAERYLRGLIDACASVTRAALAKAEERE